MSVSQPSASRRAPLREMPLDLFVAPQPRPIKTNIFGASPSSRPNKRPHSPGDVGMYSPAKRRILEVEGIISPQKMKSPSSAAKSPFSSAYRNLYSAATAKFADALVGPDSPAKKLDFSMACEEDEEGRSTTSRSGMRTPKASPARLAPSPKLKLAAPSREMKLSRASSPDDCEMTDYFASPGPRPNLFASRGPSPDSASGHHPLASVQVDLDFAPLPSPANIRHIPRVPPPPIDATSTHYPGFQIHLDAFEVVIEEQEGGSTRQGVQGASTRDGEREETEDTRAQSVEKENVPAPRRANLKESANLKRSSTDPIPELTALLFSPEGKKSVLSVPDRASSLPSMRGRNGNSMLGSPAKKGSSLPGMRGSSLGSPARAKASDKRREGSPTPKACSKLAREVRASPSREARASPAQRKERRQMLEDEVDAMEEDDDCEGVFL
ncbi:hypothetical protein K525DRAFT_365821 [Schizophyllum commune Loenen D]|nr:hypothetical protein K525DRAFT_365821 [Schizophyllum commune Loenen D]